MLFGSRSAFLPGSEVFVFRDAFVSPLQRCVTRSGLQREEGRSKSRCCRSARARPCRTARRLGKPVRSLSVCYDRNKGYEANEKSLAFFKQKHLIYLAFIYVAMVVMACFCSVSREKLCQFLGFHPTFPVHCFSFGSLSIALKLPVDQSRSWNQEFLSDLDYKSYITSGR